MKKKLLSFIFIIAISAISFNVTFAETPAAVKSVAVKHSVKVAAPVAQTVAAISVTPTEVVKNPSVYLHKKIMMTSRFSKFATLGLDYKPAFRSSENYITFMFLRDDASHKIPLSEMKVFLSRKIAEKVPDVKEGDEVKVVGTVFSNALGDVWVDADTFELIGSKK